MNFGPNRRIARLQISSGLFTEFLMPGVHPGFNIVDNGLPNDARIVGTYYDAGRDLVEVYLESETFEELVSGNLCPILPSPCVASLKSMEVPQ